MFHSRIGASTQYIGYFNPNMMAQVSKVNHHTTVSEFFTPPGKLRSLNIDKLVRLAIGTEDPRDLIRALEWALKHAKDISPADVEAWATERAQHIYPSLSAVNS